MLFGSRKETMGIAGRLGVHSVWYDAQKKRLDMSVQDARRLARNDKNLLLAEVLSMPISDSWDFEQRPLTKAMIKHNLESIRRV